MELTDPEFYTTMFKKELESKAKWDVYFLNMCKVVASKSKDPSTKVGAIIVGPDMEIRSTGWNGFPRGVDDSPERYNDRPTKYSMVVHGEPNAICNAVRVGTPIKGCSLYVYPFFPCNDCAKFIIQAGIIEVVAFITPEGLEAEKRWEEKSKIARLLFNEANVKVRELAIEG